MRRPGQAWWLPVPAAGSIRIQIDRSRSGGGRSKWSARACDRALSAAGRAVRPAAHVPEFGLSDLGRFLVGFCAPAPRESLPESVAFKGHHDDLRARLLLLVLGSLTPQPLPDSAIACQSWPLLGTISWSKFCRKVAFHPSRSKPKHLVPVIGRMVGMAPLSEAAFCQGRDGGGGVD
jgi:hypothetical protein